MEKDPPRYFKYVDFSLATFQGFAIAIFAYTCHTSIFQARTELKNPTLKRITKIFIRTTYYELIIYLTIGVFGFYGMMQHTPDMIITR